MPDILIFGMKMPKNEPLRLVLNPNGQLFVDHGVTFTEYEAVELPEHGDLIERDALKHKFCAHCDGYEYDTGACADGDQDCMDAKIIMNAPAIVPSNKEETE